MKQFKSILKSPKVTLDRLGQIVFTLKETLRLVFKVRPKLLIAVIALNAVWGLSTVPLFYTEKLILDRLLEGIAGNWEMYVRGIIILVMIRFGLEFLRNATSNMGGYLRFYLSRTFSAEMEVRMGKKLAELDLAMIEDPQFRDRFNKIERESGRRTWQLIVPLADIPDYLFGFLSSIGILFFLSPWITLGIVVFSLPDFIVSSKYIKKDYELNSKLAPLHRVWGWIYYYLAQNKNYMELKILNLSGYLSKRLKLIQNEVIDQNITLQKKRTIASYAGFIPITIFDFFVELWIVVITLQQRITVGSFQMFTRSLVNAQQNLGGLVRSFLELYENYIYVADLVWLLSLEPSLEKRNSSRYISIKDTPDITFKDVWFKYRDESPWVIKGVNLEIKKGEKVAIVGVNGAGKSTLIKLLGGFYKPNKGDIMLNQNNLMNVNLASWRKQLAVLFQEFELYPFTAREAIGYGDIKRVNKLIEVKEAAKKTGIDDYIESLPLKYENPVTPEFEKGIAPSIGQWQRIGIARMLFRKNSKVIILDEPTSNVDPEAEESIFKQLREVTKDKILIFVTQRFSTVRVADKILVVDDGKIIEQGTHSELMGLVGKYHRLFNLQAKSYQ